ncbi:MAG: VCBS repeat-containing protein [Xanthomonadales bacterium]|nr:VCBS repeat-containing protein [Xanthomonadales bacterium]
MLAFLIAMAGDATAAGWRYVPLMELPASAGMALGDLDGDGRAEAVMLGVARTRQGDSQTPLLVVIGGQDSLAEQPRSATPLVGNLLHGSIATGKAADGMSIVASLAPYDDGTVRIFSGVPLREERSVKVPGLMRIKSLVRFPDGWKIVGLMEGPAFPYRYPAVIDLASGAPDWVAAQPSNDLAIAPLGPDGSLKLIIGGKPGRILNAVTRAQEWFWAAGFGTEIVAGNFGPQGQPGFAIRDDTNSLEPRVDVFRSQPYQKMRTFTRSLALHGIIAVPQAGGAGDLIGMAEHVMADPTREELSTYRTLTGELVRKVPLGCGAPDAMAIGRIDGSGRERLVYATGLSTSWPDRLCVADLATGVTLSEMEDESGPFSAVALGDFAGNGRDEVVVVGRTRAESHYGPSIRVLDSATGNVVRETRIEDGSWSLTTPFVASAQLDSDPQRELLIAQGGGSMNDWWIEARDGLSLQTEWRTSGPSPGSPVALVAADANGDGVADALVLTSESRLVVIDGRDGANLWQSITLPASTTGGLAVNASGDTPRAIIGVGSGLYVADLVNHTFLASRVTTGVVTGVRLWHGPAGCQLGVTTSSPALTVHACDTLAPLAQWSLPFTPEAFWPIGDSGVHFLIAAEQRLHQLRPGGVLATFSAELGAQLAEGNQGSMRVLPGSSRIEVTVGSSYQIAHLQFDPDSVFTGHFEAMP